MAVSISRMVMLSQEDQQAIHPFFGQVHRTVVPSITSQDKLIVENHESHSQIPHLDHASDGASFEDRATKSTTPTLNDSDSDSDSGSKPFPSALDFLKDHPDQAEFEKVDNASQDLNMSVARRKRRKLASDNENIKANIERETLSPSPQPSQPDTFLHTQRQEKVDSLTLLTSQPTIISIPELIRAESTATDDLRLDENLDSRDDGIFGLPTSSNQEVLKLNGKGAFNPLITKKKTLKRKEDSASQSPKRKSRKKKASCLAVLKYGNSEDERRRIGLQINQIALGLITVGRLLPRTTPPSLPQAVPSRPKPTHPFFLGKIAPKQDAESSTPSFSKDEGEIKSPKRPAHSKSCTTPGKLKQMAILAKADKSHDLVGDSSRSFNGHRVFSLPGTFEPAWPWMQMSHSRTKELLDFYSETHGLVKEQRSTFPRRKLKEKRVVVFSEENIVLHTLENIKVAFENASPTLIPKIPNKPSGQPQRLLAACQKVQERVSQELSVATSKLPPPLLHMFNRLGDSMSSYDKSECEQLSWTQKYAPKSAVEVLQPAPEILAIKVWLQSLAVDAVSKSCANSLPKTFGYKKKKRKAKDDLEDFIVSSEDEASEMRELDEASTDMEGAHDSNARSMIRNVDLVSNRHSISQTSSAVLLSGPHGCGKTATVYAIAKELGFEVFEISPGSRRGGKDILDRVGDMTFNHQVRKAPKSLENDVTKKEHDNDHENVIDEHQKSLTSFFANSKTPSGLPKQKSSKLKPNLPIKKTQTQNQSLILLEEVDILFEEDRSFWETVIGLALASKRPIIMTCNDESLVPMQNLPLHAILRLKPPSVNVVADYLLLIAATEGHLLHRQYLADLYQGHQHDLRASIAEVDFWCQMGVGDKKGGLEWLYQRWPPGSDVGPDGQTLRVMSVDTYCEFMGWINYDYLQNDEELLLDLTKEEDIGVEDILDNLIELDLDEVSGASNRPVMARDKLSLSQFLQYAEYRSALDIFAQMEKPGRHTRFDNLDASDPPMREQSRADFTTGFPLLDASRKTNYRHTDASIALALHLGPLGYWANGQKSSSSIVDNTFRGISLKNQSLRCLVSHSKRRLSLTRKDFSRAFDPIAAQPDALSMSSLELQASCFDRNFSVVVEDLAPYVRSIVSFDLRLEEYRSRLSGTSHKHEKAAKRVRTTRASRSALEGSQRMNTRRDRWFSKTLEPALVLRTGGKGWSQEFDEPLHLSRDSSEDLP